MKFRIRMIAWLALLGMAWAALHPLAHPGEWRGVAFPRGAADAACAGETDASPDDTDSSRQNSHPGHPLCLFGRLIETGDSASACAAPIDFSTHESGPVWSVTERPQQPDVLIHRPARAPPVCTVRPC